MSAFDDYGIGTVEPWKKAEELKGRKIVAAGPNGALPHAIPTDREFQKGDKISQVLWSKYAKNQKLLVRDYDFPVMEKLSIVFHSYCPTGKLIWPEVFEHSMSLMSGLLMMCRDMGIPFDLCGPFTGWRKIECNNPAYVEKYLEYLSFAKHEPESQLDKISELLKSMPGNHPIFLISETDVGLWESKLPSCLLYTSDAADE